MSEVVAEALPDWRPLPVRAKSLFVLSGALVGLVLTLPAVVLASAMATAYAIALVPLGALLGAMFGVRRYRSTAWRLDGDGFALRRGRMWFRETRVPASRVQHLDLKHGPLERRWKLATLVIHTAGSKMSAVSVSGLDAGDAEALRDRLAVQLDDDDAL